jgi:hypothetical protein
MINNLKSCPKQIHKTTSDPQPQTEHQDLNIRNRKTSGNTNARGWKAPESAIGQFRHKRT